jgi:hypothetical protein
MTDQELIDLVANLAISQNKFNESLEKQSKAFEKSLEKQSKAFEKSLEKQSKTFEKSLEKQSKSFEKQNKSFNESLIELKKRSDKELEKIQKLRRSMRDLRQLGVTVGFDPEEFFYDSFSQYPILGDIKFDNVRHHVKGEKAEYDIVLYNKKQIGIVEVKNRLRINRLKEFVKKIPVFRQEFQQFKDFNILAAVAAYSFEQESDQLAQNMGLYVFSRYGQKLKPLHKDTFIAKKF